MLGFLQKKNIYRCPKKKRRVHGCLIDRSILIIYTPGWMVVGRLQDGLINSRMAPGASRLNCQNIFFQMGLHTFFFSGSDRDFNFENNNVSQV
jgi:hypothetical protein